jgi:hypothetical protein
MDVMGLRCGTEGRDGIPKLAVRVDIGKKKGGFGAGIVVYSRCSNRGLGVGVGGDVQLRSLSFKGAPGGVVAGLERIGNGVAKASDAFGDLRRETVPGSRSTVNSKFQQRLHPPSLEF